MPHRIPASITVVSMLAVILLAPVTAAPAAAAGTLTLSGRTRLVLDTACATCQGGTLDLYLRNGTDADLPLLLHTGDLINKIGGQPLAASMTQQLLQTDLATKFGDRPLPKGETVVLRLSLSGILDEGEWEAKLYNADVEVGAFSVIRVHLPFNVGLDVDKPDAPELAFQLNTPSFLPLKNDDLRPYRLDVMLLVKNHAATLSVALAPRGIASPELPAESLRAFFDDPPREGYFRDEIADGRLVMTLQKAPCPSGKCPDDGAAVALPSKVINFKARLGYRSSFSQFMAIALLLFIGALCSLLLSSYLPNQLRRIQLKKALDALAARIRDLPMKLASRLRVSLGLEEKRCLDLLTSQVGFQPGFAAVLADVKLRMDSLEKRITLAEKLGSLRVRFETQRALSLFPTPMDKVAADFEKTVDHLHGLEFSADDLQAAQTIVKSLSDQIDDLDDVKKMKPELVSQINKRATQLLKRLEDDKSPDYFYKNWPAAQGSDGHDTGLIAAQRMFEGLQFLKRKKENDPSPATPTLDSSVVFLQEDLPDVDRLSIKLEMLSGATRLDRSDPRFAERFARLADLLGSQNSETFDAARHLYQQIKERIFADDAVEEIVSGARPGKPEIFRNWGSLPLMGRLLRVLTILPPIFLWRHWYVAAKISFVIVVLAWMGMRALSLILSAISTWLDRKKPRKGDTIQVANADHVHIEIETSEICTYEPIPLRVRFSREDLNVAAAIEDIAPLWCFGHDDLVPESGWEVAHYFPRAGKFVVTAAFQPRSGGGRLQPPAESVQRQPSDGQPGSVAPEPEPSGPAVFATKTVHVRSPRRNSQWSFFLEAARLSVALVPALLGLYAGAIDKLAKLDIVSALTAVFLLGFSSDQVKNLLTQKSS